MNLRTMPNFKRFSCSVFEIHVFTKLFFHIKSFKIHYFCYKIYILIIWMNHDRFLLTPWWWIAIALYTEILGGLYSSLKISGSQECHNHWHYLSFLIIFEFCIKCIIIRGLPITLQDLSQVFSIHHFNKCSCGEEYSRNLNIEQISWADQCCDLQVQFFIAKPFKIVKEDLRNLKSDHIQNFDL